jgi:O-succinylbenzoate synthase
MISLRSERLVADDGATAFLDRDWLGAGGDGPLPALSAPDAEDAAGRLLATVDRILGLVGHAPAQVLGDGFVAGALRAALAAPGERSEAVIDCAGDPDRLLDAIARVRDLGVVILAGEPVGRELAIDLYVDVHRRGLHVLGAPRPEALTPVADAARVRAALEQLARVPSGAAPPTGATWLAVG